MKQCKQCGATPPEDSNVCLQCGTKNAAPKQNSEDMPKKELDFLKPALAGGGALALLTSITAFIAGAINVNVVNLTCYL